MGNFQVGDRVRVKTLRNEGKIGIIRDIEGSCSGVEYQEKLTCPSKKWNSKFPDKKDYGWYEFSQTLELLPPINHCPQNKTVNGTCATVPDLHLVEVQTIFNGPATVCVLKYDGEQFKGVAKCNPADQWNETIGQIIATERAAIKLSEYRIAQAMKQVPQATK